MPAAWYNMPEAKSILAKVTQSDLTIGTDSNGAFIWTLDDSREERLETLRYRCVDALMGYNYNDPGVSIKKQNEWFAEEEQQASIHQRLMLRFGDPDLLHGYGLETAQKLWKRDPFCLERMKRIRRDVARVQKKYETVGG